MNVGKSVRLALEALRDNDLDTGMLHACNAFDGTAKRSFPTMEWRADSKNCFVREHGQWNPSRSPGWICGAVDSP